MNKKKIVILSAVIVALTLVLVWVMLMDSPDSENTGENADSSSQEYTAEKSYDEKGDIYRCSIESISDITVISGSERFRFVKSNGNWKCDLVPEGRLDNAKVMRLATGLGALRYVDIFDDEVSPEECGITDGTPTIVFASDIGEVTLRIADSFNDENLCYVTASVSDSVYSVKKSAVENFFLPLESYRNDSLMRINSDSVEEIKIANENGIVVLKKGKADKANAIFNEWRMIIPVEISASDTEIAKNIFEAVENMKISRYVDDNANFSAYGLGAKDKYVSVGESGGKVRTLYFGDKKDGMYYVSMESSDSIYAVDEELLLFATLKPIDLADRHVKLVMKDSLSKIIVESADKKYTVEVSEERNESKINGRKLEESEFSGGVFASVCGLIADDIYTGETGDAEVTITYVHPDGTSDKIEFSTYDSRYYAVCENGNAKFLIQKSKIDSMFETLSQFE